MTASISGALLCLLSLGAAADWKEDYRAGRDKCKAGQYAASIPLLREAFRNNPKSCTGCIRTGMFFEDYFPLYYLGRALMETGQTGEAVECFERLEAEGKIKKSKELAGPFQMALQTARASQKPVAPAQPPAAEPPPSDPAPGSAPAPPTRVEPAAPPPPTPPPSRAPEPSLDPEAVQAVKRKLDGAERQLQALDPENLRDHPRLAKYCQGMIDTVREIRGRLALASNPRQVADLDERAGRLLAQAPRLARSVTLLGELKAAFSAVRESDLKPHADLAREAAALRDRMRGAAERSWEGRGERDADEQIAGLEGILRDLNAFNGRVAQRLKAPAPASATPAVPAPTAAPPPTPAPEAPAGPRPSPVPRIREGFEAFFGGDFEAAGEAARSLASGDVGHPYAALLRGVVAWTRFASSGSVDAALKKEAREAFAAAKRAGLTARDLPRTLFSPKLIAFFDQAR